MRPAPLLESGLCRPWRIGGAISVESGGDTFGVLSLLMLAGKQFTSRLPSIHFVGPHWYPVFAASGGSELLADRRSGALAIAFRCQ